MSPEEQKEQAEAVKLLPRVLPQDPLLRNLPKYLKDPANYEKIMRAILDAGATRHSHGEIGEWTVCKECQGKQTDRLLMMKKLGFSSGKQYMAWRRVHERIRSNLKMPFEKYNSK